MAGVTPRGLSHPAAVRLRLSVQVLVAYGLRRVVLVDGLVWIEEDTKAITQLRRFAIAACVVAALGLGEHMLRSDPKLLVPLAALILFAIFGLKHLSTFRGHRSIAPTAQEPWRRIGCGDPSSRWFWSKPRGAQPLASVYPRISRAGKFGHDWIWTLELRWLDRGIRLGHASRERLFWGRGDVPPELLALAHALEQHGFGRTHVSW